MLKKISLWVPAPQAVRRATTTLGLAAALIADGAAPSDALRGESYINADTFNVTDVSGKTLPPTAVLTPGQAIVLRTRFFRDLHNSRLKAQNKYLLEPPRV